MKKTATSLWYGNYINAHSSDCSNSGHAVRRGFPPHFLSQKLRYQLLSRGGNFHFSGATLTLLFPPNTVYPTDGSCWPCVKIMFRFIFLNIIFKFWWRYQTLLKKILHQNNIGNNCYFLLFYKQQREKRTLQNKM